MTNEQLIQTAKEAMRNDTVLQRGIVELLCNALTKSDEHVRQLTEQRDAVNVDNVYLRDQVICWARECDRITFTYTNKVTDAHQMEAEQELANTLAATSAILDSLRAEAKAEGVDLAISHLVGKFNGHGIGVPVMALEHLARQLRESKGDNHE